MRTRIKIAVLAFAAGVGCAETTSSLLPGRPVATPDIPPAAIGVAARVDQVGRSLLAANPFLGVDPVFHTVAAKEPVLFHPDLNGVMISDGLVERCESDDDLAAVLAAELGQMAAERRTASRNQRPPLPVNLPDGSNQNAGGISSDQVHLAELAAYEKRYAKPAGSNRSGHDLADEVLRSAGRDAARLDRMADLIENARANRDQFGGLDVRSSAPKWSR